MQVVQDWDGTQESCARLAHLSVIKAYFFELRISKSTETAKLAKKPRVKLSFA